MSEPRNAEQAAKPEFDPNTLTGESKQIWTNLEEENRRQLFLFVQSKRQRAARKAAAVAAGPTTKGDGSPPRTSPAAPSSPRSLLLTELPDRGSRSGGRSILDLGVSVGWFVFIGGVAIATVVVHRLTHPEEWR